MSLSFFEKCLNPLLAVGLARVEHGKGLYEMGIERIRLRVIAVQHLANESDRHGRTVFHERPCECTRFVEQRFRRVNRPD